MSTAPARPPGRYGEPAGPWRRRALIAAVVLGAAAALAWLVWVSLANADRVRFDTQGYDVVDDTRVVVTFSVTKEPGASVECTVEALSGGSAQVGLQVVRVGPTERSGTLQTVEVRTQQRAVTGQVRECRPV